MGRKSKTSISFRPIHSDGAFITKPYDIVNHFNNLFIGKVDKIRNNMQSSDGVKLNGLIEEVIKKCNCQFEFHLISIEEVKGMLTSPPDNNSAGTDNLDSKVKSYGFILV